MRLQLLPTNWAGIKATKELQPRVNVSVHLHEHKGTSETQASASPLLLLLARSLCVPLHFPRRLACCYPFLAESIFPEPARLSRGRLRRPPRCAIDRVWLDTGGKRRRTWDPSGLQFEGNVCYVPCSSLQIKVMGEVWLRRGSVW